MFVAEGIVRAHPHGRVESEGSGFLERATRPCLITRTPGHKRKSIGTVGFFRKPLREGLESSLRVFPVAREKQRSTKVVKRGGVRGIVLQDRLEVSARGG